MFLKHGLIDGKRHNDSSSDAWQGFFPGRQSCWSGAGGTLLEIIVSMGIVGVFFLALYGFFRFNVQVLQAETVRLSVRESSRLAIDFLVRELRMAGARPVRGGACEGFERLVVADEQTVSMQYDFRGDRFGSAPDGCPDDPSERVLYTYDADAQMLRRATGRGRPQPFIGDMPPDGFLLSYFDRDGTELLPPLDGDARAAVFLIDIVIRTARQHPDPGVTQPIAAELGSAVFLSNPPS